MDDYLTKPLDRARLESCLEHYLGGLAPPHAEISAGSEAVSESVPSRATAGHRRIRPRSARLERSHENRRR